ncbi:MAG: tetratricopeptide repeat protein [Gemmatimonadota bacterium]
MGNDPFHRFLSELKRRKVTRVAVVYAIAGWAVVEGSDTVTPLLLLPDWVPRLALVLVLIGFPLTLVAAWAFEITPEGVKRTAPVEAGSERSRTGSRLHGALLVVAVVAVAALAGYSWGRLGGNGGTDSHGPIRSLAVLPLDNLTGDEGQAYFVDGMHDELISELARIEQIKVLSRTSTLRYRHTELSVGEIARELGVDGLIEGSVFRDGDSVRITVQLIRGHPEEHLWTDSYRGDLSHALALHSRVARSIAQEIRLTLRPDQEARLADERPVDPRAQEAYLQGRALWRTRQLDDLERAVALMEEAVALDPEFARGWSGLADAQLIGVIYTSDDWDLERRLDAYGRSRAAARKALALDADLAEAQATLGYVAMFADLDWREAERGIRRSLALNPSYAQGWDWLADVLRNRGRTREAVMAMERAVELDPFSALMHRDLGFAVAADGRCEEAVPHLERALELDPRHAQARVGLAMCDMEQGADRTALEQLLVASEEGPRGEAFGRAMREAYGAGGWEGVARVVLRLENGIDAATRVWALVTLGRFDEAVAVLRNGFDSRDPIVIQLGISYRGFDALRDRADFHALMRDVGLEEPVR